MKSECARNVKVLIMINQDEVREMKLTERQTEAVNWVKSNYHHWRKRLMSRPEELPKSYRHFWRYPFGIHEWNEHIRIARRVLWQGKI